MDALELTMRCSKLLKKPYSSAGNNDDPVLSTHPLSSSFTTNPALASAGGDGTFLDASFTDADFDLSRLTAKEGNLLWMFTRIRTAFFPCLDDDRMSEASVDISKASRSGSSQSESSQELINDDDNETPYIAAPPEEMGEVRLTANTASGLGR